jgi:hypothetical protein
MFLTPSKQSDAAIIFLMAQTSARASASVQTVASTVSDSVTLGIFIALAATNSPLLPRQKALESARSTAASVFILYIPRSGATRHWVLIFGAQADAVDNNPVRFRSSSIGRHQASSTSTFHRTFEPKKSSPKKNNAGKPPQRKGRRSARREPRSARILGRSSCGTTLSSLALWKAVLHPSARGWANSGKAKPQRHLVPLVL